MFGEWGGPYIAADRKQRPAIMRAVLSLLLLLLGAPTQADDVEVLADGSVAPAGNLKPKYLLFSQDAWDNDEAKNLHEQRFQMIKIIPLIAELVKEDPSWTLVMPPVKVVTTVRVPVKKRVESWIRWDVRIVVCCDPPPAVPPSPLISDGVSTNCRRTTISPTGARSLQT